MLNKNAIKSAGLLSIIIFIMINPLVLTESVKNGMLICYNSIIPSLYVFTIFANYRSQSGIMEVISIPFRWYGRLLKIEDNYFAGCLAVSLLGGFSIGANYLNILKSRGYSDNTLNTLSISLINNSFSYCVFAVGVTSLGNIILGIIIYLSLILSSLITAFLFSFFYEYNIVFQSDNSEKNDISLVSSIKNAVETILVICGFVIFFNFVCEVILLYSPDNNFYYD